MDHLRMINDALQGIDNDNARAAFAADLCLMGTHQYTHLHYAGPDTANAARKLDSQGILKSEPRGRYGVRDPAIAARLRKMRVARATGLLELREADAHAA